VRLGSRLAFALALVIAGCGGGSHDTHPAPSTTRTRSTVGTRARAGSVRATQLPPRDPVLARLGLPALHDHSPLPGYLLIADRDNNRIIIVNPSGRIVWRFPQGGALASGQEFAGPDDAFITPDGRFITTNEELSDTVAVLSLERHPRIVWQYGHQDVPGSGPGYLAHPDDAYMVHGNEIQVADIINCRVLWLGQDRQIVHAIGTAGDCVHDPPHALLAPNGDTPLPDGGVLVTEIGGWVDRFTPGGKLVWSIKTPTDYPSDAQLLPDGDTLVAGYNDPGRIDVITPAGHIAWTYGPPSGPGSLNQPSLAVQLPNGLIAATDDWNERVVVIDPRLHRIVWQYGHDHVAGSAPGYLRKPDGLDLVP
jgi:DNA-binding beta-propeller fold protein YncE